MLRIKKYNDGIRVYGYFNMGDYILITENNVTSITSAPTSLNEMVISDLVGEIYDYFKVETYEKLVSKTLNLVKFVLGNKTKIENFDEVLQELKDDGEVIIELDIDKELDTKEHVSSIFNSLKNAVDFELGFKVLEFKSKKGYVKSRELIIADIKKFK